MAKYIIGDRSRMGTLNSRVLIKEDDSDVYKLSSTESIDTTRPGGSANAAVNIVATSAGAVSMFSSTSSVGNTIRFLVNNTTLVIDRLGSGIGDFTFLTTTNNRQIRAGDNSDPSDEKDYTKKKYVDNKVGTNVGVLLIGANELSIAAGSPGNVADLSRISSWDLSSSATNSLVGTFFVPPPLRGAVLKLRIFYRSPVAGAGDIVLQGFMKTFDTTDTANTTGEMGVTDTVTVTPTDIEEHEYSGSFTSGATDSWGYVNITRLGAHASDTYGSQTRLLGAMIYVDGAGP